MSTSIGNSGEDRAADYLKAQGFKLVERNFKTPQCEIDIIARRDGCLYFVEVKYRKNSLSGDPYEFITKAKLDSMTKAAKIWLNQSNWEGEVQLAAIGVAEGVVSGLASPYPMNIVLPITAAITGAAQLMKISQTEKPAAKPVPAPSFDDPLNVLGPDEFDAEEICATLSADESELVDRHRLTAAQIAFRRSKKSETRRLFLQEYPEDDETCFLTSGTCYFDVERLLAIKRALPPYERKHVPGGYEVEWEPPEQGVEYVMAADTSEGIAGCDPNGLGVLRRDTGVQVCSVHGIFNPPTLAEHCVRVAKRYNGALLGIERQNHGHAVIQKVQDLGYGTPHFLGGSLFYYRKGKDQVQRGEGFSGWSRHGRAGWSTDAETRPVMLQQLRLVATADVSAKGL